MFGKINMKMAAIWLTVIMIGSFAVAGVIFATQGVGGIFPNGKEHDINEEKLLSLDGIKDINVSTVSENINVIPADTNEVKVHYYGTYSTNTDNIPKLVAETNGDKINIQIKHKTHIGFNITNNRLKLDLYIPKTYTGNLDAHTVSGELVAENFSLNGFTFTAVSGDIKAKSLKSTNTKISTTSGSADLDDFTGNLDFHAVSGDLDVSYANYNYDINMDTTSGSANIRLPENAEFELKFTTVSGDISNDFPMTQQGKSSKRTTEGTVGSGKNKIAVRTISGDIQINK